MFRKRRTAAPGFRLPVPFDPMWGEHESLAPSKPVCDFALTEALTTSDESVKAEIVAQYGYGTAHSMTDKIIVHNLETHTDDLYMLEADSGDKGRALWDHGKHWVIVQLECP